MSSGQCQALTTRYTRAWKSLVYLHCDFFRCLTENIYNAIVKKVAANIIPCC